MKTRLIAMAATAALALASAPSRGAWTLGAWNFSATTGHYYSVQQITGGTTGWLIARTQAQALTAPGGGAVDLATITSSAEDAFVFAGVDDATFWSLDSAGNNEGPNIGGYQTDKNAEPAGHFVWVTGEPFVYTQYSPGEPNNNSGTEDYLTLFGAGNVRTGNWNDISSATSAFGAQGAIGYYVAESVPEPTMLLASAALPLLAARRRRVIG